MAPPKKNWDWRQDPEFLAQLSLDLRRLAIRRLRSGVRDLSVSSLVQESLVRLLNSGNLQAAPGRAYVHAAAARAMRFVIVDHARASSAAKRDLPQETLVLEKVVDTLQRHQLDILALDEAMESLMKISERQAAVVELRFFGGLTMPEVAHALDLSLGTVEADWRAARNWLYRFLNR
ncbi:MAG: ECF-type sigma factor [Planctomycetaceae bacterium]